LTSALSVVVTGAAQGIGLGIASRLVAEGWHVWCVDVDEPRLVETARSLREAGAGAVTTAVCDLSSAQAITDLWSTIDRDGRPVHALINNAGIFRRGPAMETTLEDWTAVLSVNLTAGFLMSQQAARRMLAATTGGSIVSLASGQAYRPNAHGVAYAVSKAGVVNMTRALAAEWGPLGIRVNTVVPGLTDTAQPRATKTDPDFEAAAATVPLRRLGTPADIAGMVSFLLSNDASHITGQSFAVNGGRLML
jgi:NAD(P)-dependent dehydrogenase (short-subunit alcohol dehydrogenase family)